MAGPGKRGGRGAGGSGEVQTQGQPRDSAMAPVQPSLGPPRDEPRVFGLDKFDGDNFAEWSFKMENIFDHYDLLEVMEGTEKRSENDPEKSPWVRKSAQGYLLLGQALGSSQIRHIKPFQREPEDGPKPWADLKGICAPTTAAVAVVLERQMAALRIEEDEAVEEEVQKFLDLLTRLEGADLNDKGKGAGGGRGRGRGGRGGRGGGAANMKSAGNESELRDDRFPGQFFFVSTQAPAGPEKDEGFEEPAAMGKVTLHSLDYWRAEVKGMGKAMFKGADGKMVGLKNCGILQSDFGYGKYDWLTLHRRIGHVALPILQQLVKNEMVAGIRVKGKPDQVLGCPTCMQAKFTHYPFSSLKATDKAPLDEVVMDVVGPLKLGTAGAEYFLTIVDVYTRMTWVYVLSKKSDVAETVKTDWLPMVERQQDRLVKAIRTDRGGEFLSKEFSLWLKKNGIRHSLTMPYSLAMNGIAARANRTITETAHGLLIEAGLPEYFWPDAVRIACVAKNRALTHVGAEKRVPYMEWIGRKPKVDMLRVFGCMCMALMLKHLRHYKLGAKAIWAAPGKPAKSALAGAALIVGDDKESDYEECAFTFFSPVEMPGEPATLKESLESSDAEEWKKAMERWVVKQMDMTTAFLNGVLEEEIFMAQPEGFDDGSGRFFKLKKALCGLKQAPRQWYLKLRGVLEEIGFTSSSTDHSLFMLGEGEQRRFMVVYVDDILIFSPSSDLVKEVMLKLQDKFKCKALGDSEGHVATPFPSGFKCVKGPEEESVGEEERRRFHSWMGSLVYGAVNT
ncbi:unnamed protein product [Closterium sp. NIES-53]